MPAPFTLAQIEKAHQGVNQASVGKYLKALRELGVVSAITYVVDGHTDYADADGNRLSSAVVHETYGVSDLVNWEAAQRALDAHTAKEADYFTMSRQLAAAGVATWVMNTTTLTCSFVAKDGTVLITETVRTRF